ncbi:transcription repressor OFP6-like [Salvia hispanica]|uniref:transcription repressor OFP6-like n=1 Tax=Salvia hispanica TaxID=49212 RepID=UPI0020090D09|nr:transcription repressor OFP6-like [Salvia hispanica]
MSGGKKRYTLSSIGVRLGCSSSSCRRPKISAVFQPKRRRHSSSSSWDNNTTTTTTFSTSSDAEEADIKSLRAVQGFGRIGGSSVAVEKDSDDPYLDFRQSMLQMILEKEIYSKDDLKHLLNCFLQLNSPYYHRTIVRAFTEIWNGVYSHSPSY